MSRTFLVMLSMLLLYPKCREFGNLCFAYANLGSYFFSIVQNGVLLARNARRALKDSGWIFNPLSLQTKLGKQVRFERPNAEWVGKVIGRIGQAAGMIVELGDEKKAIKLKYASAHDLRRSCGDRLRNAGVPPLVICRVMRHSSWDTTRRHYVPGDVKRMLVNYARF